MSDIDEEIWLTYEGIKSEVDHEYSSKFDATEANKQWAVARRMFMAGKRSQQATAQRMYQEGREHAIQDLIEKIGPKAAVYSHSRYGDMELEWDYSVAEWLKSQMEGGE